MAREIRWSPRASENLADICEFIAKDSDFYTRKVAREIYDPIEEISDYPNIGRVVPEYNEESLRERIYQNYRIVYRLKDEIVAIHHSSRPLSDL